MAKIQFITHCNERYGYVDGARMALEGGCKWIQLRMKDATEKEIVDAAAEIEPMCREHDAIFIVDDHVELVEQINADGVHLGQNDMRIDEARRVLGERYIIGGTANTYEQIVEHYRHGADYIGCGPFRFTSTKKNLSAILGLDGYRRIVEQMKEAGITIPVVAIGGIGYDDIREILKTGILGIALSGSVLGAENPVEEMRRLISI